MIDGIEIWNYNSFTIEQVESNPLFNLKGHHNWQTGEVYEYPCIGNYKGLKIKIAVLKGQRRVLILEGSLHQYFNNGVHNYNLFTTQDLATALLQLEKDFCLRLEESTIHNLEIGVAFQLPIGVEEFCQQLISYKGKPITIEPFRNDGFQKKLGATEHYLKFYDKGSLSGILNQIRVELCCKKQRIWAGKTGIKTLANLLELDKLLLLQELLIEKLQYLIVYDRTINLKVIPLRERELLINGQKYFYWKKLKAYQPETYKKKRAAFIQLVSNYGKNNPLLFLQNAISNVFKELVVEKSIPIFPDSTTNKTYPNSPITTQGNSNVNTVDNERCCISCGRDISHQKGTSKFCSEKYFGKAAKSCRNKDSNPRNHLKKKQAYLYGSKELLFDTETMEYLQTTTSKNANNRVVLHDTKLDKLE